MTKYAADTDGAVICVDCLHGACVSSLPCEADACECECGRARRLDERPVAALDNLARDVEHETRPAALDLHHERYGDHRTLAAERKRRST